MNDIADLLKVSRSAVYKWVQGGKLRYVKIGRLVRIPKEEVERVLSEGIGSNTSTNSPNR